MTAKEWQVLIAKEFSVSNTTAGRLYHSLAKEYKKHREIEAIRERVKNERKNT